jgi:hypothetical protein
VRIRRSGAVQSHAQTLDLVDHLKSSAAPAKVLVTSLCHGCRRPHQWDMTLVSVGTAAPGVITPLNSVEVALEAQGIGRGRDFVISIGLRDKGGVAIKAARGSTLGLHRGKQAIK